MFKMFILDNSVYKKCTKMTNIYDTTDKNIQTIFMTNVPHNKID